jgi:hypothetical protein
MGDQIRIADIARRLVAAVPGQVDIVYTGLRPGEKLTEDLLSAGEPDDRPCHPLIRQVPVSPLAVRLVTGLDAAASPAGLRAALAACARAGGPVPVTVPAPAQAADSIPASPAGRPDLPISSLT